MKDDTPVYEVMFSIAVSLSERFPSMNPLTIRRARAHEIFLLISRLGTYIEKENKSRDRNGNRIIRRPAGDNWF